MTLVRVAILAAALHAAAAAAELPSFQVTLDAALPDEARWAQDVRWASADEILVTAGRAGVYRMALGKPLKVSGTAVGGEKTRGGFFFSSRLAAGSGAIVTASPFGAFGWKTTARGNATSVDGTRPFATIIDIDVSGDDFVILGADRDDKGRWAPEGAIAWRGSLADGGADLWPVHFSTAGPQVATLNNCGRLEMSAIRFLGDGSFVIVPGFEPGVFLYDANGKLKRTWPTAGLGFEDRCKLTAADGDRYARSAELRDSWHNRHTIVEEILPLPSGPGLVLRTFDGRQTGWSLLMLDMSGRSRKVALPVTSPSPLAHLRADVRGDSIVFLVAQYGALGKPPLEKPRVVVAKAKGLK